MPQRENHYDYRSWSHIGEPEVSPDVVVRLNVKTKYSCEVVFKGGPRAAWPNRCASSTPDRGSTDHEAPRSLTPPRAAGEEFWQAGCALRVMSTGSHC